MWLGPPFPGQQLSLGLSPDAPGARAAAGGPTASVFLHFQPFSCIFSREGSFEVLTLKSSWTPAETTGRGCSQQNGDPHPKSLTASAQASIWRFSGETLSCLSATHRFLSRLALTHTLSKGTRQPGTPEPHHTVVFLFSDQRIRDKAPQPRGQASLEALVRLPQR